MKSDKKTSTLDPDFAKTMAIARRGIKEYRNTLIDLASKPS